MSIYAIVDGKTWSLMTINSHIKLGHPNTPHNLLPLVDTNKLHHDLAILAPTTHVITSIASWEWCLWLGGLHLLHLVCLVTCRCNLGNIDLVVCLTYELIKGNTLVELYKRHTIDHAPSIGLSIIPIVANAFLD